MDTRVKGGIILSGRRFSEEDLQEVFDTAELLPEASRKGMARIVCEELSWVSPSGRYKIPSCIKAMEKLEALGFIQLPKVRKRAKTNKKQAVSVGVPTPQPVVSCNLAELQPLILRSTQDKEERSTWNEYIERHHYLGYKRPFGAHLRYFIYSKQREEILGCLLFAASAWSVEVRDNWIGWTDTQKSQRLPSVINNSRYLIFPWVQVKNLASHVLSLAAKQVRSDWQHYYGHQPVLLETFVDPEFYKGTCYKAANWQYLGMTKGRGRMSRGRAHYLSTPKQVYVYPLVNNCHSFLCRREGDYE